MAPHTHLRARHNAGLGLVKHIYKIAFIFYPKSRELKALVLLEFFVAPNSALRSLEVTL
jgi:hypothetical protein